MKLRVTDPRPHTSNTEISTVCPHCGKNAVFEAISSHDVLCNAGSSQAMLIGYRRCPDRACLGQLFYIKLPGGSFLFYPSSKINFNKEHVPENVLNCFEEAVICHSNNCFTASAIMIRKTLEEICGDRGAKGKNLDERLNSLRGKIVIPEELIEAMHELRLLGNDAAHIESKTFQGIGKEEIEISIEFTKEILKAVYQYESLLTKLRALKKQ
jgi:hypothetical protein